MVLVITGYSGEVLEDELGGLRLAGPGLPADHDALVLPVNKRKMILADFLPLLLRIFKYRIFFSHYYRI